MTRKTQEEILEIYRSVSSSDFLLFHVAHARKQNNDREYDGAELRRIADERVANDVATLKAASQLFHSKSKSTADKG